MWLRDLWGRADEGWDGRMAAHSLACGLGCKAPRAPLRLRCGGGKLGCEEVGDR